MTNNEQIGLQTESKDHKPLFILGMLGIADHQSIDILENRRGLLKGNSMLLSVNQILLRILLKTQHLHNYIIIILRLLSIR